MAKAQESQITGYRELTKEEIALINKGKDLGSSLSAYLDELEKNADIDQRSVALAKTNLQQGLMWAIRSIAKPESF